MIPEAGVVPAPWQQRQATPGLCTQIHCMWGKARGWDTSGDRGQQRAWFPSRAQGRGNQARGPRCSCSFLSERPRVSGPESRTIREVLGLANGHRAKVTSLPLPPAFNFHQN